MLSGLVILIHYISPQIPPSQLSQFHARYGTLLKASMAPTMRKRDKKKEKAKTELVAKKRKELYEDVTPGGKRPQGAGSDESGAKKKLGHRQRVRLLRYYTVLGSSLTKRTPQQRIQAAQSKKVAERERLEEKEAAIKNSTSSL